MKYLLCNEVVRELDFERQCTLAAQLGYDGLELAPFTLVENPHKLQGRGARRSGGRPRTRAFSAARSTGCWSLPRDCRSPATTSRVRRRTLEVMEGLVELCASLGGKVLVHGSPAQRALPEVDREGARMRGEEAFAQVACAAEAAGVTYCIEPLSPKATEFVNTVAEAAEIVEAVGSKALRTMVDFRDATLSERKPAAEVLEEWLPKGVVAHVHLNDSNRRVPGQGKDDFAITLEVLERLKYDGFCGVEPFIYEPDGPTTAARAIGYLRGIEAGLGADR